MDMLTAVPPDVLVPQYCVRREVVHHTPGLDIAALEEAARRRLEGNPDTKEDLDECRNAVERWLNPETVDRSLVREALWTMEQHFWAPGGRCRCGTHLDLTLGQAKAMRNHREDIIAHMLGLTIKD